MPEITYKIYALFYAHNKSLFYVGSTDKDLDNVLNAHIHDFAISDNMKEDCLSNNFQIQIVLLQDKIKDKELALTKNYSG